MKKVALVSGWYVFNEYKQLTEDHRYILDCLYSTAKKYFLKDCDVDYIFLSNEDIQIEGVKNIKIEYGNIHGFWHMCLMKILALRYIPDDYDAIFVCDTDQIFVNPVKKEDLDNDMVIVEHFYYPKVDGIHESITNCIDLNFNTKEERWTMGNFFGGKREAMKGLLEASEKWHAQYINEKEHHGFHFYTRYPEELFLIKYIYENNVPHTRLATSIYPHETGANFFLSNFQEDEKSYESIPEVRLIHNTKQNVPTLKKIITNYI